MKTFVTVLLSLIIVAVMWNCSAPEPEKQVLFNGTDFTGWNFVVDSDSVTAEDIWAVEDGVVTCAGVPNGYMITDESFENYKLHVEWRWTAEPTNSGVLLHCGADLDGIFWPNCFECQLKTENAGDFVLIGPGQVTVGDSTYVEPARFTIVPKMKESNEKPVGEWNTYDITVKGNTVSCEVNGELQNVGTDLAMSSGPIALQSEGSPIEFRNIYVEPIVE